MGNSQWRQLETGFKWDSTYEHQLIDDIKSVKLSGEVKIARILLWGQIQAGKSSFINSVASIDEGRMAKFALVERDEFSCTKQFRIYKPKKRMSNFCLMDMMGLQSKGGVALKQTDEAMRGHILPGFTFNNKDELSEENQKFFKTETNLQDKVHCTIFMVDAEELKENSLPYELIEKFNIVKNYAKTCEIATLIVLTKIDDVSESSKKEASNAHKSKEVSNLVKKAHEMFGVSEMDIFPIKNYKDESELNTQLNILILLAVRQAVRYASDHIESIQDQTAYFKK